MPTFRYTAVDRQGQQISDELIAETLDLALATLTHRGFTTIDISATGDKSKQGLSRMSSRETEVIVGTLAAVSNTDLPLGEGLRAAADESTSGRVSQALRVLARRADQGQDLQAIVADQSDFLPPHVRGLVKAGARTRRLGAALDDLVEHHRSVRDVWSRVLLSIAYPLTVLFVTAVILAFLPLYIVPQFKQMFEEFDLELPAATQMLIGLSDAVIWMGEGPGKWLMLACFFSFVIIVVAATFGIGTAWTQRFAATMPLVGPMWYWSGAAAFSRLLAMMIEQEVPLDEALTLSADGVSDPNVRQAALLLARRVENGASLADAMQADDRLPATMIPFVKWGEKAGDLPDGLRTISDILLTRVHMRAAMLRTISPPVVFLLVGLIIGFVVISLFMPMVSLIQGLS